MMGMVVLVLLMLMANSISILSFNPIMLIGYLFYLINLISRPLWRYLLYRRFEFEKVLSNEDPTLDEEFTQEKYLEKVPTHHKDILTKFSENAKGKLNIFPSTKLLPSYLFCFVAGPYKQLKC
jgi:hypothetical protein